MKCLQNAGGIHNEPQKQNFEMNDDNKNDHRKKEAKNFIININVS